MINFSFVIPHKNLQSHYLRRCLDSIPHDDDIEIIILDDNSSEEFVDFEVFPGLNEKCTKVLFNKEGKGPGYLRNTGIREAKGRWILFADADDCFQKEQLEEVLNFARKCDDYEVLFWSYNQIELEGNSFTQDYNLKCSKDFNMMEDTSLLASLPAAWQKMTKRSFILKHNIKFDEVIGSEDIMFALYIAKYAKKVFFYSKPVYCHIKRGNSLETSYTKDILKSKINVSMRANRFIQKNNMKYRDISNIYMLKIKEMSRLLFYYYFVKEIFFVNFSTAKQDYLYACIMTGTNPNPIIELFAPIIIWGGNLKNKILQK